jgi:hypothetical protein
MGCRFASGKMEAVQGRRVRVADSQARFVEILIENWNKACTFLAFRLALPSLHSPSGGRSQFLRSGKHSEKTVSAPCRLVHLVVGREKGHLKEPERIESLTCNRWQNFGHSLIKSGNRNAERRM